MRGNRSAVCILCINALIVVLELIALVLSFMEHGIGNFCFYTQDSNYLAMAASLFVCWYAAREIRGKGKTPQWVHSFRYITVSCLMVTFFVVLLVLMPMSGENAPFLLYGGSMLYHHTICPLLTALSFFVFEEKAALPKTEMLKAILPTLLYALVVILLNILRFIEGPYPFLMVYRQPWYMSVMWCIVILGIAGFLAFAVLSLYNQLCKKK